AAVGAVLPDYRLLAVVVGDGLGVGDVGPALALDEDAAGRGDAARGAQVEAPADDVEHGHAHVAEDAVGELVELAPALGVHQRVVRDHRGGADPEVVVEVLGRLLVGRVVVAAHRVVAEGPGHADAAEVAGADEVAGGADVRGAAALGVDLHDAVEAARGP